MKSYKSLLFSKIYEQEGYYTKRFSEKLIVESPYRDMMIKTFRKALQDELTSAMMYEYVANKCSGFFAEEIIEEFKKHAKEEYEHYTELLDYASNNNLMDEIGIVNIAQWAYEFVMPENTDKEGVIQVMDWKQNLEEQAKNDYLNASEYAMQNGDLLTHSFFLELANDEMKHQNDLNVFYPRNQKRSYTKIV